MMQFPQYGPSLPQFPQYGAAPYSYSASYSSPFGSYANSYSGFAPPQSPSFPPVYHNSPLPTFPPQIPVHHHRPQFPVAYPPIGGYNISPFGDANIGPYSGSNFGPYAGANVGPFAGANVNFGGNNNDITNQLLLSQLAQPRQQDNGSNMMMFMMMLMLMGRNNQVQQVATPVATPVATTATAAAAATATPTTVVQQPATVVQQPQAVQVGNIATQIQQLPKSPLVADLNGDGVKTSDRMVQFDIDGDGQLDNINDISEGDGLFSIRGGKDGKDLLGQFTDVDGDGKAESYQDGFDALKALAARAQKEGLINGDTTLDANEIATLEKAYGLGVKKGGFGNQSVSLSQAGIQSINLATGEKQMVKNFDGRGNDTLKQGGALFTRADGTSGNYEDVFFLKK